MEGYDFEIWKATGKMVFLKCLGSGRLIHRPAAAAVMKRMVARTGRDNLTIRKVVVSRAEANGEEFRHFIVRK